MSTETEEQSEEFMSWTLDSIWPFHETYIYIFSASAASNDHNSFLLTKQEATKFQELLEDLVIKPATIFSCHSHPYHYKENWWR